MLVLTAAVLISPHALPYNLGRVPKVFRWPVPLPPMLYGDGATDRVDLKKFPWWAQLPKEIFHPWGASKQSLTRQVLPCDGYHLRRSEMLCGLDRLRLTDRCAISSKKSSTEQTLMGTFLCDALRKELEVDCVLFDGGNIRGDRTYLPQARHHRGSKWAFTVADLRRELPWPSQMATVTMEGWQISEAVQASRIKVSTPRHRSGSKVPHMPNIAGIFKRIESSHQLVGGFLQCDSGMQVRKDSSVSHIAGEDINLKKRYTVAVLYDALMGMNQNPVFEKWRNEPGNRVPGQCPAARELLTRHFLRRLWKLTQNKLEIKEDEDISRDKLLAAISKVWPRAGGNMRRSLLRRLLATVVAEDGSGRGFKSTLEAN
eukprot:symbB.v1.2.026561.t1/scaffold2666.1/size75462/1